jgi:hypothetical protein
MMKQLAGVLATWTNQLGNDLFYRERSSSH